MNTEIAIKYEINQFYRNTNKKITTELDDIHDVDVLEGIFKFLVMYDIDEAIKMTYEARKYHEFADMVVEEEGK